jgi:hypothetical protein
MTPEMHEFFAHGIWDMLRTYNFFVSFTALVTILIDAPRWWHLDRRRRLLGVALGLFCISMVYGTVESRLLASAVGPRNAFFAAAVTFTLIASLDGIRQSRKR